MNEDIMPPMQKITLASPADLEAINEIARAVSADSTNPHNNLPELSGDEIRQNADGFVLVCRKGKTVQGYLQVSVRDSAWFIDQVHVHPEHQGKGAGTALLNACFKEAASRGRFHEIKLGVAKKNGRAIELYKRLGFKKAGGNRFGMDMAFRVS